MNEVLRQRFFIKSHYRSFLIYVRFEDSFVWVAALNCDVFTVLRSQSARIFSLLLVCTANAPAGLITLGCRIARCSSTSCCSSCRSSRTPGAVRRRSRTPAGSTAARCSMKKSRRTRPPSSRATWRSASKSTATPSHPRSPSRWDRRWS